MRRISPGTPRTTSASGAWSSTVRESCWWYPSVTVDAARIPRISSPGGALHPGEHLVDGVIREVREETGICTKFESAVCFRHWHGYRFGKSDIYFVCRLSPLSESISRQVEEIDECLWMSVEEYLADHGVSPFNKRIVRSAMDSAGVEPTCMEGYDDRSRFEFFVPGRPA